MKVSALQSKLSKLNVTASVFDYNGYNKSIRFSLNGKKFEADYNEGSEKIESISTTTDYDERSQESERSLGCLGICPTI